MTRDMNTKRNESNERERARQRESEREVLSVQQVNVFQHVLLTKWVGFKLSKKTQELGWVIQSSLQYLIGLQQSVCEREI